MIEWIVLVGLVIAGSIGLVVETINYSRKHHLDQ